jgi:hypothetical protein
VDQGVVVISSHELERAEHTLKVVYGGSSLDRQLKAFQVEREAFDNFLAANVEVIKQRYGNAYHEMDPRLEPAWMTLMLHMFLSGLICGHNEMRTIE